MRVMHVSNYRYLIHSEFQIYIYIYVLYILYIILYIDNLLLDPHKESDTLKFVKMS